MVITLGNLPENSLFFIPYVVIRTEMILNETIFLVVSDKRRFEYRQY